VFEAPLNGGYISVGVDESGHSAFKLVVGVWNVAANSNVPVDLGA
jgi:hypothetical protein